MNGKFVFKKLNYAGTLGQRLMGPPEMNIGKYPFILYNPGGSLLNNASAALAIALLCVSGFSGIWRAILMPFAIVSFFFGILNTLPITPQGIPSDGGNAMSLIKEDADRKAFWWVMRLSELAAKGENLHGMPPDWLDTSSYGSNTPLIAGHKMLCLNALMDNLPSKNLTGSALRRLKRLVEWVF
jgi:hypothetical protein